MKRLIVCCDGTWNRPDQAKDGVAAPTNVAKLALALAAVDAQGNEQRVHYQAGVGTRAGERFTGGGFGIGLSRNVQACYRFLVDNYEPGDELYFLGFSRGAFTARSLAGLVRNAGILRRENSQRIEEAYRLYRDPHKDRQPAGIAAELFRRSHSHPELEIEFIGVWDTVGALGIPVDGPRLPWLTNRWTFHDTDLSTRVRHAYHAIAIDEKRKPFRPTLWKRRPDAPPEQVLEQVWFAGVHCDVGGGYRDPSLSELPLLWMVEKAQGCGLEFRLDRLVVDPDVSVIALERRVGIRIAPDPLGEKRESRSGFYKLQPAYDRRLSDEDGQPPDGGAVAPSAAERFEQDPTYRPPGLAEALAAAGSRRTAV